MISEGLINYMRNLRKKYRFTVTEQALFYELLVLNSQEKTDVIFCSNTELTNSLNICESSLINARKKLISAGLLSYHSAKSKRSVGQYSFPNRLTNDATNLTTLLPFTDKDSDKSGKSKPTRSSPFIPPRLEEVKTYCLERKNGIDPQTFIDHYTANGWMRGKTKVKDWKACVRTWEQNRSKNENNRTDTNRPKDYGKGF